MLKRQSSCGDRKEREREREIWRRGEERRRKGRGWTTARTAAVTHFAQCFYAAFCTTFEERPTPTIDSFRWQANASFHTNDRPKDTLQTAPSTGWISDKRLQISRARSKIFPLHFSCEPITFIYCSIFLSYDSFRVQIRIWQMFANIQSESKLVRWVEENKEIDRILIHLPGRVITRRFDVPKLPEAHTFSKKSRFHLQHSFPTSLSNVIRNYVSNIVDRFFQRQRREEKIGERLRSEKG